MAFRQEVERLFLFSEDFDFLFDDCEHPHDLFDCIWRKRR
jgi:hypothetical protein